MKHHFKLDGRTFSLLRFRCVNCRRPFYVLREVWFDLCARGMTLKELRLAPDMIGTCDDPVGGSIKQLFHNRSFPPQTSHGSEPIVSADDVRRSIFG